MEILLVRHGEAKTETEDPERSLTDNGIKAVEGVAALVYNAGVKPHEIRHSGKRRARQTAEIMAAKLEPAGGVAEAPGLKPNDDVYAVAEDLERGPGSLMIVGHLPFLGRLAGLLVTGNKDRTVVQFDAASAVCLSRREGKWLVRWAVSPELTGNG